MNADAKHYLELVKALEEKHTHTLMEQGMPEKDRPRQSQQNGKRGRPLCVAQRLRDKNGNDHELPQPEQLFQPRCCNRAQWEIRAVADEMLRLVYPLAPHVFAAAGPRCLAGPCPEGGMCCGKQNAVRDKYATLKQEAENHG